MGNSTSKTDATLIANAQRRDASSVISGESAQPMGIMALPPHLQMSKIMCDDEDSLLSSIPSATPLKMPPQQQPLHQTIHRGLDAPLLHKESVMSRKKQKKKKWSLGARKRVLNNLRGVRNRTSILNRANNGEDKKYGKVTTPKESVPADLYIPRDDSWRSTSGGAVEKVGGTVPIDASQQLHLALPLLSPLPAPSSERTPTYGIPQSPSGAPKTQPLPLPSPQPSPRRSRHPMKQEVNTKSKKSSKVPAKKKTYAASTKPSLYKKPQPEKKKHSSTSRLLDSNHASADVANASQGVWKPMHEKSGTSTMDRFAEVEDTGAGKSSEVRDSTNAKEANKKKVNSRPSNTSSFAASSSQSRKSSIFKGLKKQFTFKKRIEGSIKVERPVENGASKMLECAVALHNATSSDSNSAANQTAEMNNSNDGHVLGMMPNAPLNLSDIDLEASYTSNDRSFAESEAGVGNVDMSRLLGNIIEEDEEEKLERDIDNEFLFLDDKEQDVRGGGISRSEKVDNIGKSDTAGTQLQSKRGHPVIFDVSQKNTEDTPGADSEDCSSVWNLSPIRLGSAKTNEEEKSDEKASQRSRSSVTSSTAESSTVNIPAMSLNQVFAEMSLSTRTTDKGNNKNDPSDDNMVRSSTSLPHENGSQDSGHSLNTEKSLKAKHKQEQNTFSLHSNTVAVEKEEIKGEEAQLENKSELENLCANNDSTKPKTASALPPQCDVSSGNGIRTKDKRPGLPINENELSASLGDEDGKDQQLVLREEQSCTSPKCETLLLVDGVNPRVVAGNEREDDHKMNRQILPALPHDTPTSFMSTTDSLNTSIRRSSPRQAISKEAMFNASFLFSPNNNAFLARRSYQSSLPAIQDNFASKDVRPKDVSKQHSSDSTVSGLSNVSSEGRVSNSGSFISPSSMNESESNKERKTDGSSFGHREPNNQSECVRDGNVGFKEESPDDGKCDLAMMDTLMNSSNLHHNRGVGDDAESLFTTESENKRDCESLNQSKETAFTKSDASSSPSTLISECSPDQKIIDKKELSNVVQPISTLPVVSPTSTSEDEPYVGEGNEGDKEDNEQQEDISKITNAELITATTERSEEAQEGSDNLDGVYLPASLAVYQTEASHTLERKQTCEGEPDKPPVLLTPWKKSQEPNTIRTISPIRRFRSAKEKFAKQVNNSSPVKKSVPGKLNVSSQQQSLVLSRVTEIDGRLRKNRQIARRNKRRDTSGGGVLAPRKATLVNPLFNRVPSVEECPPTTNDHQFDSCDGSDEESILSTNECAEKRICDDIDTSESLDRAANLITEAELSKKQTADDDKCKLDKSTCDAVCLGRLGGINSTEEDKQSGHIPEEMPVPEVANDTPFASVTGEEEREHKKLEERCLEESSAVSASCYTDKYLSQASDLPPQTESNCISTHVDTPRSTIEAGGFDDIIDGSLSVEICTKMAKAQEKADEKSKFTSASNYAEKYLPQTSSLLPQAVTNKTSTRSSSFVLHEGSFDNFRQCDSPESYTFRDTSLLSTDSDDVFATLAKCNDKPDTHDRNDGTDLFSSVTEIDPYATMAKHLPVDSGTSESHDAEMAHAHNNSSVPISALVDDLGHANQELTRNAAQSDETLLEVSAVVKSLYGSNLNKCTSSNDCVASQENGTPNGSEEDKENFSPYPEPKARKSGNISFVLQTDLCLSPVQRTSQQARKWRTLAAAAAANKSSTKRSVRKKGRKKKQKNGLTKSRPKATPLAPVKDENAVN